MVRGFRRAEVRQVASCSATKAGNSKRVSGWEPRGPARWATLAPASYAPAKFVQASVSGTSSANDLAVSCPKVQVAQGATVDVQVTARLLANGAPASGQTRTS